MNRRMTGPMPGGLKSLILIGGLLLLLLGLPITACGLALMLVSGSQDAVQVSLILVTLSVLTLGAGIMVVYHANRSSRAQASAPLRLPRTWLMAGWFVLALLAGILAGANQVTAILFFVPALL
ncbi:MAG: hypothetical protein WCF84_24350, partial [Anaerolineae bacterium]